MDDTATVKAVTIPSGAHSNLQQKPFVPPTSFHRRPAEQAFPSQITEPTSLCHPQPPTALNGGAQHHRAASVKCTMERVRRFHHSFVGNTSFSFHSVTTRGQLDSGLSVVPPNNHEPELTQLVLVFRTLTKSILVFVTDKQRSRLERLKKRKGVV